MYYPKGIKAGFYAKSRAGEVCYDLNEVVYNYKCPVRKQDADRAFYLAVMEKNRIGHQHIY